MHAALTHAPACCTPSPQRTIADVLAALPGLAHDQFGKSLQRVGHLQKRGEGCDSGGLQGARPRHQRPPPAGATRLPATLTRPLLTRVASHPPPPCVTA